jgi:ankyrin repeat protein
LFKAAAANDVGMMSTLLASNADPNIATRDSFNKNMTTPLMYAAYHCNMSMVQVLLNKGVNRNATNPDGVSTAYDLARTGWTTNMKVCSKDMLVALSTGCYGSGCPGLQ